MINLFFFNLLLETPICNELSKNIGFDLHNKLTENLILQHCLLQIGRGLMSDVGKNLFSTKKLIYSRAPKCINQHPNFAQSVELLFRNKIAKPSRVLICFSTQEMVFYNLLKWRSRRYYEIYNYT